MNIRQSLRIIFRNKTYSLLNILGLSIGIASAALILMWVEDEVTFNNFPKEKQLYALYQRQFYGDKVSTFLVAPTPLADVLKEEVAGIKDVFRLEDGYSRLLTLGDKMIYEKGAYTDSSFFSMLDVQFIKGSSTRAFDGAYPLVLTETTAKKFFGAQDPIGQSLTMENKQVFQITGVVKDPKANTSFQYSWLTPFRILIEENIAGGWADAGSSWGSNWMSDYVELKPNVDVNTVNAQIKNIIKEKRNVKDGGADLFLYPISKLKLYGEFKDGQPTDSGFIRQVRLFSIIACVILLIACINFMNLSTARSQKRMLEVGIRKTFGAKRKVLISQFMIESSLITFFAIILALIFIALSLPQFNQLIGKQLTIQFSNPVHWLGLFGIGVVCSFLAGSYPAFYLSSFPPIDVLRRLQARAGNNVIWLRKGLVVFQFAISVALIICTSIIYLQIQHGKNRSLGMEIQQVINIPKMDYSEPLSQKLMSTGVVENVGFSNCDMLEIWNSGGEYEWSGKSDKVNPLISRIMASPNLVTTLGIKFIEGHDFESAEDGNKGYVIINESLAKIMGSEGRIGGQIRQGNEGEYAQIIGIVNNFVFNNIYQSESPPTILFCYPSNTNQMFVCLKPGNAQEAINKVGAVVKEFHPNQPFEYKFMNEQLDTMFHNELLVGKLAALFAALAIFISCIGLYGLTAFSADQRTKEIGIRKVLGATVWNISEMLSRDFLILVFISFIIAMPLAWGVMHQWLQGYSYRISMNGFIFVGAGLLVVAIAMITVGFQAIKAATANPVKSIKSE